MRLYIKDEYFEAIRNGKKKIDYREAHITFANEKTKELLKVEITAVNFMCRSQLPKELKNKPFLKEDFIVSFELGEVYGVKK